MRKDWRPASARQVAELSGQVRELSGQVAELSSQVAELQRLLSETQKAIACQADWVRHISNRQNDVTDMIGESMRLTDHVWDDLQRFEGLWQAETVMSHEAAPPNYYLFEHIERVRALFPMMEPAGNRVFRRVGRHGDGGYVMLDDFAGRSVAYSFGILDDVSWDLAMAAEGLDVYQYDHTIDGLPEEHPRFHWQRRGIAGRFDASRPELVTLPMLLEENGHAGQTGMILKMDVEGAEWEVLLSLSQEILSQFDQVVIELHDLNDLAQETKIVRALSHLNETHAPVHVHANNCSRYIMFAGRILPDVLEVTYLRRGGYDLRPTEKSFPSALDEINAPRRPELVLGHWGMK